MAAQQFSVCKDVVVTILKLRQNLKSDFIDAYLRDEHSCQISSWPNLKQRSFRLFLKWLPNKNNNNKKNKMSSDMRSVPDLKILSVIIIIIINTRITSLHKLINTSLVFKYHSPVGSDEQKESSLTFWPTWPKHNCEKSWLSQIMSYIQTL